MAVNRSPSYENITILTESTIEGGGGGGGRGGGGGGGESAHRIRHPRPPPLHIPPPHNSSATQTKYSSEMIAPFTPPPTRYTTRWRSALSRPSQDEGSDKKLPRAVQVYYKRQKKDIEAILEARRLSSPSDIGQDTIKHLETKLQMTRTRVCASWCKLSVDSAARLTLSLNFLLFFFKLGATIQSGSLAVLSSALDSGLDLFSGAVIAVTSYLIRRYNRFYYPIGRNRLEPVAIIITASVMGTAALQVITKAIEDISTNSIDPQINIFSGGIIGLTVILKGALYLLCRQVNNASIQTLAVDHRNDVVANIFSLIFGLLGTYVYKLVDPIGGIFLALYIIVNWVAVGYAQLKNLVGHTADRRFLSKLTWLAANHDIRIMSVDTVRAYTFGINYLVEVHIQLPASMPLREAHDIGESLQQKVESLDEIERAFVHLDHETEHCPMEEHKIP